MALKLSDPFKKMLLASVERFEQFTEKEMQGLKAQRSELNEGEKIILDQFLAQFPEYLKSMQDAKKFLA